MGPSTPDVPVRFRVRIDGQPPAAAHGSDIDDEGTFEITFLDPGAQVYAFTFG